MTWLDHKIPPPVVGALVGAAMWGVASFGPQFAWPIAVRFAVVFVLIAAGIGFDVAGILAFRRAQTTVNPLKPESASALVTGGIYRFTRNPMYVGMVLFLLAWGAYLGSSVALVGPLVFVLYITRFQIQPEERALRAAFGAQFEDYSGRVRRWL